MPETAPHNVARHLQCVNCGADVSGKYCSACGQETEYRSHSLPTLLGEAAEALTHADSRLWRTLGPLILRPGFLTREFLDGRRARYLPPLRLYLVFSVLFFLAASFVGPLASHSATATTDRPALGLAEQARIEEFCRSAVAPMPGPNWVRRPFLTACFKSQAGQGRELSRVFTRSLGQAMFLFLPLLAAVITPLYGRTGHYYVDHLLLLLHDQALLFLLMTIYLVALHWARPGLESRLLTAAFWCYVIFYFYRSMQTVYAENWHCTLLKFGALALGYLVFAVCTVFLTSLYTAEIL